jgi:hypothetical protein
LKKELNVDGIVDDFSLVHYYLPTAIKVAQKTSGDIKKWYNEIGFAYLRMAELENKDDRNWIKFSQFEKAIEAFRKAGNASKKKETEQIYFELKPKVKLTEYKIDFSDDTIKKIKQFQEELKSKARSLLKEKPEFINFLILRELFS